MIGQIFTRLAVIDTVCATAICICDCGNIVQVRINSLRSGNSKSCGCLRTELKYKHKLVGTPTYNSWRAIVQRTQNSKAANWKYYGGKGIKLSVRWLKFTNFLEDMGVRPEGTTLDRINPYKHYIKSNCRWADNHTQAINKRDNWKPFETDITF